MPEVPRKMRAFYYLLIVPLAYILYLHGLRDVGLIGPDEPRYAAIARQMAQSGDWITPRLWGEPWFEKPALLYWMSGAGFLVGLGPELAPRLPVVLLALAFLGFFWWCMRREFGNRSAWLAVLILGTGGGWLGFSSIGATDLPLTATFSAAMLLALPWLARGETRLLPAAAACLGAAVLAKGLVPLVLVLPLLWMGRRKWRNLLSAPVLLSFLVVALPWYALCLLRNGRAFFNEFFVEHHFSRFTSDALMHRQPWWFYLPVLVAGLLPWTPLLAMIPGAKPFADIRTRLFLAWAIWGLAFFSASANKLPGYVLPLIPALAALCAIALDRTRRAGPVIFACALLLVLYLAAAQLIAPALAAGLSRAARPQPNWIWTLPVLAAALAWLLEGWEKRLPAVLTICMATAACVLYIKVSAYSEMDEKVSARGLWRRIESHRGQLCVEGSLHRSLRYGLNYYSVEAIPECSESDRPFHLVQPAGKEPSIEAAQSPELSLRKGVRLDLHSPTVVPSPFRN